MKNTLIKKFGLGRVDAQVSIFTALVVTISCALMYFIGYTVTYNDMIASLSDRVYSIYNYLEKELVDSTFDNINNKEDMDKECYREMKELFSSVKDATGVRYLYTAKKNSEGALIYVIDGLPETAEDFRYPGDLIEKEITGELSKALAGAAVLPNDIVNTAWGDIFIAYLPIHDARDNIIGVIGIEFEASHQYQTYYILRITMPIVIILSCLLCAIFAVVFFRRISNPRFQDLANTDYLTQLKNRNAYEVDIKNIYACEKNETVGIIIADLDGLKYVNDNFGHEKGDLYIKLFADALRKAQGSDEILYRTGGDEFLILIRNAENKILEDFIESVGNIFIKSVEAFMPKASCSFGKAVCVGNKMEDFEQAYRDADNDMYKQKKAHYQGLQG